MFALHRQMTALLLSGVMVFTASLAAMQNAAAYDINLADAYGDEYGNIVVQDPSGPKMIFVGSTSAKSDALVQELRRKVPVYKRGRGPAIISPPGDPYVVGVIPAPNTSCDSPIVIRGRGYMYGIDRNETPVLGLPGCQ